MLCNVSLSLSGCKAFYLVVSEAYAITEFQTAKKAKSFLMSYALSSSKNFP